MWLLWSEPKKGHFEIAWRGNSGTTHCCGSNQVQWHKQRPFRIFDSQKGRNEVSGYPRLGGKYPRIQVTSNVLQLWVERSEYWALKIQHQRKPPKLEIFDKSNGWVPSQLSCILHDGGFPGWRNPQRWSLPRLDAARSEKQTILIINSKYL